jgi:hypothetical protein
MNARRLVFALVAAQLCALAFWTLPAAAGGADTLKSQLTELSGWEADDAETMDMDMGGTRMITAARSYAKDDRAVEAMLFVGPQGMAQGQVHEGRMETAEGQVDIRTVDGFTVGVYHQKTLQEGAVMVTLLQSQDRSGVFTLSYQGMNGDQALELAKSFDWQAMRQAMEQQ